MSFGTTQPAVVECDVRFVHAVAHVALCLVEGCSETGVVAVKYVWKTGVGAAYNMSAFDTLFAAQVNVCVLETVEWLRNCMFVSIFCSPASCCFSYLLLGMC